jgi:hypothetical protein
VIESATTNSLLIRQGRLQAELLELNRQRKSGSLTWGRYGSGYRGPDAERELQLINDELARRELKTNQLEPT